MANDVTSSLAPSKAQPVSQDRPSIFMNCEKDKSCQSIVFQGTDVHTADVIELNRTWDQQDSKGKWHHITQFVQFNRHVSKIVFGKIDEQNSAKPTEVQFAVPMDTSVQKSVVNAIANAIADGDISDGKGEESDQFGHLREVISTAVMNAKKVQYKNLLEEDRTKIFQAASVIFPPKLPVQKNGRQ